MVDHKVWSRGLVLIFLSQLHAFSVSRPGDIFKRSNHCLGCRLPTAASVSLRRKLASVSDLRMSDVKIVKDHKSSPSFTLAVLGDLHLDPADMDLHNEGRDQILNLMDEKVPNRHVVSLGDLGAYGSAGTSANFHHAKSYLDSFKIHYDLVTGNHDLEGMDEFQTDEENLKAFVDIFQRKERYFCTEIADKTLCIGMSTVRFRDAVWSSHEVFVDQEQIDWFRETLEKHPAEQGWRVLVFTHAPIMGSGLTVLQGVHVKNGCAWINHTDEKTRKLFYEMCIQHKCIKAWFSGHFHLSHDYQESITTRRQRLAFVQVGVIGAKSQRDGRRQTRIVRGDAHGLRVYTVNHHQGGRERLDMEMIYASPDDGKARIIFPADHEDYITADKKEWFSARKPQKDDGCYLDSFLGENPGADVVPVGAAGSDGGGGDNKVCWWHMADGRVLGVHDGMLVEYDSDTLSPLGVVMERDRMAGKELLLVEGGKVAMLLSPDGRPEVIQPNDDGSYWRRFQRNKLRRSLEKERDKIAQAVAQRLLEARGGGGGGGGGGTAA